jgi:putative SOS response-associated peptidase YedK
MCARYETLPDELPEPFSHTRLTWVSPRLSKTQREMFPGYLGPVVRLRRGEPGLDAMRWGLIPFWANDIDPRKHRHTFNARAETIDTVASFKEPFLRRRCLVPASCFMEFPTIDGRKVRHRVTSADGSVLTFAGVWDRCSLGDDEVYSYTIITTEPADGLRWLHHRLPVVLGPAEQEAWMDPAEAPSTLKSLLISPPAEALLAVPDD